MSILERIQRQFEDSARVKLQSAAELAEPIARAIEMIVAAVSNDYKIIACGNGGSAAECQHFVAALMGRFERERMPLAAIALSADSAVLTALSNDYSYEEVFARQINGLGRSGDILLALSSSGNSKNVVAAIEAAHERDMLVIALTGKGGGTVAELLQESDVHLCVPHDRTARIQEVHRLVLHCICDGIDWNLMGDD